MSSRPNTLIIGAGIVGLTTALQAQSHGLGPVTILDEAQGIAPRSAPNSTWAGGGILWPLLPWNYGEALWQLVAASLAAHESLSKELITHTGIDPELIPSGMLLTGPIEANALSWLNEHHIAWEALSGDGGQQVLLPQVRTIRPPRLLRALAALCTARGITIHHETARAWHCDQRGVRSVRGDSQTWHAERFVVCAGAYSSGLLGPMGEHLGIRPIRGQMLLYRRPGLPVGPVLFQEGHYLIPRQDGHVLVGSTLEDVGFDGSITTAAAHTLHAWAGTVCPALRDHTPIRHWAGLRPGSRDNVPLIGRHPELDNMWVNAGHFRYGVTMAPASARLLVQLMTQQALELDPAPYAWPQDHSRLGWQLPAMR